MGKSGHRQTERYHYLAIKFFFHLFFETTIIIREIQLMSLMRIAEGGA